jgi:glyceraldehyde 3-phosphate dehydrogenase
MAIRIGINGFGRIGRLIYRTILHKPEYKFDVLAVNDITDAKTLAYLLKYDTVFGTLKADIKATENEIIINGIKIKVLQVKEPDKLPWRELEIDWAIEATGKFTNRKDCEKHLQAGAKKVLLTAPSKDPVDLTCVMGVNHAMLKPEHKIITNASCTTNCLAPVAKVLHENFKIKRGLMTTIHAYTNDQRVADQVHKDFRRARAAGQNIIPTTTGAAKAIGLVIPELKGKLDGVAMRVPIVNGSVIDLVVEVETTPTKEEVNRAMKEASEKELKGVMAYTEDPIVSSDIIGTPYSAIFDALSTMVIDKNFIKVVAWYDNEWAYSLRCIDLIYFAETGKWPY